MPSLDGKIAVVTGASRGIGAAIARALGAEGAAVAVNYARSADAAQAVVEEIRAAGGRAEAIQANMAIAEEAPRLFEAAGEVFGPKVDILVNNAGMFLLKPLQETTLEDFQQILDLNVRGVFLATKAAAERMGEGGRIITIGSVNGHRMPMGGGALYAMSKAAVQGLTRGWARDLGPRGITVNCVQPGPVDTDMNPADSDFASHISAMTAVGRYGRVEEVAALVLAVAKPDGSYITGATLDVDGGFNC